ncbi:DNA repair protein complementing XP-A cells -like protein [Toxocara canis]|uniref:DNA repair protein complementing XP-A cells-like protein n=1 Tax=Toxocara canis TaxID=6265 RepID=A0A0B2VA98_TOXCA|nr:DNA repair protein complementing XP-A cells -like protein [Toxocara canis]
MKRHYSKADDEDRIPIVEKLYKKSQECYANAGGFLDDDDEEEERRERISQARQRRLEAAASAAGLVAPDDCSMCKKPLLDSFLWDKFNYPVCDKCRDEKNAHKLIPRTEAKAKYMLKDCDLDLRKPVLRYISKKNPHNPRYGDMKLYLKAQLEERCLEIYESWGKFDEMKESRAAQKEERAEKSFERKIRQMRRQLRGPKEPKITKGQSHEHSYGEEVYDEEKSEYISTCTVCGYHLSYEKF